MSDLLAVLQRNKGRTFMFAGFQPPGWKQVGFERLDSLGLKWYSDPPPITLQSSELIRVLDADVRTQWMFYWLFFDKWLYSSGFNSVEYYDSDRPIDHHFTWQYSISRHLLSDMNEQYLIWTQS